MVYFPRVLQEVKCPVPGCPVVAHSAVRLRKNFVYRHFGSKVEVFQEGIDILPRCDLCVMHIPVWCIIRHRNMSRCDRNTQMRWRRRDVAIAARCL